MYANLGGSDLSSVKFVKRQLHVCNIAAKTANTQ
jgi:hypothetical protein